MPKQTTGGSESLVDLRAPHSRISPDTDPRSVGITRKLAGVYTPTARIYPLVPV